MRYEEHHSFCLSKLTGGMITSGYMFVILLISSNRTISCWFSLFGINISLLCMVSWAFLGFVLLLGSNLCSVWAHGCPVGSPCYLETLHLKIQTKSYQHILFEMFHIYSSLKLCFLYLPSHMGVWREHTHTSLMPVLQIKNSFSPPNANSWLALIPG